MILTETDILNKQSVATVSKHEYGKRINEAK